VLRDLRIERGLTQVELAQGAGVSKSMLSLYEGEKQRPQLDTLEKLLDALGVRLGELAARLVPGVNYFCAQF
jgi:transcriptional regulator with XRE-family HTH domain